MSRLVAGAHHTDGDVGHVSLVTILLTPTGVEEVGIYPA
jgi:hypothetical protein